ncbi:MAG: Asp-tRNA(Asn)/Glu-tRNA(Gln) amidotransferase subunit GatC [Bacillota bacterium]|nr:Asp-tRNA(Asn)/Glu-tRNA(Gln) amidotransferase subunit GatC [Bacillota bacterium]
MITREDILNIALLAKLDVAEDELDNLTKEMSAVVAFADAVNEADIKTESFDNVNNLANVFRSDEVQPSLPNEEIIKNALDSDDGYFVVKKRA